MKVNDIAVRIGGQAGDGALTTGDTLALVLHRMGLYVITFKDFPSQIRGIHTNYTIRAHHQPVQARPDTIDVLMAFDHDSIERHTHELAPHGYIIYESSRGELKDPVRDDLVVINVPLRKIAQEVAGREVMKNTVALGVLAAFTGLDRAVVEAILKERFLKRKGMAVVEANLKAFDAGYAFFEQAGLPAHHLKLQQNGDPKGYLMIGNEAIAFGALVAGCRFYAGYPITPASEIMEWLAKFLPKYNGVVIQAEDEIASINLAAGAALAGARAMTATSGPGFSLMTEGLGYIATIEAPVVLVNATRSGPSTGMPTKTEQGDIFHSVFGGHGDFPRIVLSPKDAQEAYHLIIEAFNLAEEFQMPVIFFIDQFLAQNKYTVPDLPREVARVNRGELLDPTKSANPEDPEAAFPRYRVTDSGVSPRTIPGTPGGIHWVTGLEHTEYGHVSTYAKNRVEQMNKRFRKLETAKPRLPRPVVYGNTEADRVLIVTGSTTGAALEAMDQAGGAFFVVQVRTLWPFEVNELDRYTRDKAVFVAEVDYQGQLAYLVEHHLGRRVHRVVKYNGRPFRPSEIKEAVLS